MQFEGALGAHGVLVADGRLHTYPVDLQVRTEKQAIRIINRDRFCVGLRRRGSIRWNRECKKQRIRELSDIHYYRDINGEISGLGGNVSEWMDDEYVQWGILWIQKRMELIDSCSLPDADRERAQLEFSLSQCDKNGVLVRGGNWYDETVRISPRHQFFGRQCKDLRCSG